MSEPSLPESENLLEPSGHKRPQFVTVCHTTTATFLVTVLHVTDVMSRRLYL